MTTLKNYKDVQNALNDFCKAVGVDPAGAPHGAFWNTLSYEQFTTGNVPGFKNVKVLAVGSSGTSNIIQILEGIGPLADDFGAMPPGVPLAQKKEIIAALSQWIDAKCPN
jgi:hypothetical protein